MDFKRPDFCTSEGFVQIRLSMHKTHTDTRRWTRLHRICTNSDFDSEQEMRHALTTGLIKWRWNVKNAPSETCGTCRFPLDARVFCIGSSYRSQRRHLFLVLLVERQLWTRTGNRPKHSEELLTHKRKGNVVSPDHVYIFKYLKAT